MAHYFKDLADRIDHSGVHSCLQSLTQCKHQLAKLFAGTILAFLILFGISCAGEIEKKQVFELKKIAEQIPICTGCEKIGEKVVLKKGMVYFFNYYQSKAEFSDIKEFYSHVLTQKGWVQESRDDFRRGNYVIAVEKTERVENRFNIVYLWYPK